MNKLEIYIRKNYPTFKDFAQEVGISRSAVSMWINSGQPPGKKMLRKIDKLSKGELDPNYFILEFPDK